MSFEARLFIQGVGSYVTSPREDRLVVLFPDQSHYPDPPPNGLPSPAEICDHHAVVQMDLRHLAGSSKKHAEGLWGTLVLDRQWLGIAGGKTELTLGSGLGLISLASALPTTTSPSDLLIDPNLLPQSGQLDPPADRLSAGLYLDSGTIVPHPTETCYQSLQEIGTADPFGLTHGMEQFTQTIEVDLGQVDDLRLLLRTFGEGTQREIPLEEVDGKVEIWIRHFCDLRPPASRANREQTPGKPREERRQRKDEEKVDRDFLLNYLLLADGPGLMHQLRDRLMVPVMMPLQSGTACRCMPCKGGTGGFVSPFTGE